MDSMEQSNPGSTRQTASAMDKEHPADGGVLSILPRSDRTSRPEPEQSAEPTFDYTKLISGLRGRVVPAIVLALVGSFVGSILGWHFTAPVYECEGLIRIAYTLPSVMSETDQNGPIAMYETFLRSQQLVMQSRRIIELAFNDPAWQATGLGQSADQVQRFAGGLTVDHPTNTENLRVAFRSGDPVVAAAAVKSIIDVFAVDYGQHEAQLQEERLKVLDDRGEELRRQLADIDTSSGKIMADFGGADPDRVYDIEAQQYLDLTRQLAEVRMAMALGAGQPGADKPALNDQASTQLSAQEIAMTDPVMRSYLVDQDRYQDQLADLTASGLGVNNPEVELMNDKLKRVQRRIDDYIKGYAQLKMATTQVGMSGVGDVGMGSPSEAALRSEEAALAAQYAKANVRLPNLLKERQELDDLKLAATSARQELNQITERRESLRVESAVGGRLEVVSTGEVPVAPLTDRRAQMSAAAALMGGLLPVMSLAAYGFLRRRLRYADETASEASSVGHLELLGVLPSLSEGLVKLDEAADTAQSVHQIRVRMQTAQRKKQGNVYLVTSASPGEGKTNITAALALSFAASGSRTLLIDFDLVGRRLSSSLRAENAPGLGEALASGRLNTLNIAPNLGVLSAGGTDSLHASTLSAGPIRRLIHESRGQYDAIFIDSGPILGSIEASVVTPEVDGVVMVVSRGQRPELVDRALYQLRGLGAQMAGVIFNRANLTDFARSCTVSSSRSTSASPPVAKVDPPESLQFNLGPLVTAVLRHLPAAAQMN